MTVNDVSQPVAPSNLLTVQEVVRRLRISESKCRRMIRNGELPAIRLGVGRRAVRIDERELEAWLRSEGWDA